ncbi:hypothetical protein NECAME_17817 [Necator americanus]|uniref:Uncharacterized protein n=1 Tax=Necator americanus TaxID=51031 RepID=W2TLS4_NECAM|nr:hypothetical protein NECAME_17817 [Necator americanus]ETN81982.1 hypothetical protein NECAME_17817 [Necator americanus]
MMKFGLRQPSSDDLLDEISSVEDLSPGVRPAHIRDLCNGSTNLRKGSTNVRPFDSEDWEVEYFVASDAAAIIEHTKQVLFLEDDDVAVVMDGGIVARSIAHEIWQSR